MTLFRIIPEGDLHLDANGSIVLISGAEYVRQTLSTRFRFFLGEWFLDRREGVPYFRHVFIKNPDIDVIRSVFREVILSVDEVATIKHLTPVYDPRARTLAFSFEVTLKTGDALVVAPTDRPFILNLGAPTQ